MQTSPDCTRKSLSKASKNLVQERDQDEMLQECHDVQMQRVLRYGQRP